MKLAALVFSAIISGSAFAEGTMGSGGGNAVICRDQAGNIKNAELLDLYEGTHKSGLILRPSQGSFDRDYVKFLQELRRISDDTRTVTQLDIDQLYNSMRASLRFLPPGGTLPPLDDIGQTVAVPPECSIDRLALYDDNTNLLTIRSEIWDKLDAMNQAALIAHEIIYKDFRWSGANKTSEDVRSVVAKMFSTTPPERTLEGVPSKATRCWARGVDAGDHDSQFYMYPSASKPATTILQFRQVFGQVGVAPLKVEIPITMSSKQLIPQPLPADAPSGLNVTLPLLVNDPFAHTLGYYTFMGDQLKAYKLWLIYDFHHNFAIALVDSDGEIFHFQYVMSCTDDFPSSL